MRVMGRHRTLGHDLPPRMRLKDGIYYFDQYGKGIKRKWIPLGRDLRAARTSWSNMMNEGDTQLFGSLHDKFISECLGGLSDGSKIGYTYAGGILCGVFGDKKLSEITPVHIGSYLDGHPKASSANFQIGLMRRMYEKAMRWGWCTTNPCLGISRNKLKKRDRYVEDSEFIAVRNVAPNWLALAMDISYLTTMSEDSVIHIKLPDLQPDGVHTRRKKSGKRQIFEWTDGLTELIDRARALPRRFDSILQFSRKKYGQPIKRNTFISAMTRACERAGVDDFHFHDIRAKAATDAARKGQNYFLMLGHANRATSDGYVKSRTVDRVLSGLQIVGTLQK